MLPKQTDTELLRNINLQKPIQFEGTSTW